MDNDLSNYPNVHPRKKNLGFLGLHFYVACNNLRKLMMTPDVDPISD